MGIIRRAFLHRRNDGRLDPEVRSVAAEMDRRGVPHEFFVEKHLYRGRLALAPDAVVVGHIPIVVYALGRIGVEPPLPNDYPASLRPWMHRHVWRGTVGGIVRRVHEERGLPLFVKPAGQLKRFTGGVVASWSDLSVLAGASDSAAVYCCAVVAWVGEFRVFVTGGRIVGTRHYAGSAAARLDEPAVREAVACFEASGEAPAGYGIDFGVLADGRTALVEVNDGYGLGSYGLEDAAYTDLIVARWCQLVGNV